MGEALSLLFKKKKKNICVFLMICGPPNPPWECSNPWP